VDIKWFGGCNDARQSSIVHFTVSDPPAFTYGQPTPSSILLCWLEGRGPSLPPTIGLANFQTSLLNIAIVREVWVVVCATTDGRSGLWYWRLFQENGQCGRRQLSVYCVLAEALASRLLWSKCETPVRIVARNNACTVATLCTRMSLSCRLEKLAGEQTGARAGRSSAALRWVPKVGLCVLPRPTSCAVVYTDPCRTGAHLEQSSSCSACQIDNLTRRVGGKRHNCLLVYISDIPEFAHMACFDWLTAW